MKLNLGCGKDYKKGFVNIDVDKKIKADKYLDLNNKFPFKDNSVDFILSSHNVEHIINHKQYLKECFRVLKKEGVLELRTPNYSSLGMRLCLLFGWDHPWRDYNHVRFFTYKMIVDEVKEAGFEIEKISGESKTLFFLPAFLKGELRIIAKKVN